MPHTPEAPKAPMSRGRRFLRDLALTTAALAAVSPIMQAFSSAGAQVNRRPGQDQTPSLKQDGPSAMRMARNALLKGVGNLVTLGDAPAEARGFSGGFSIDGLTDKIQKGLDNGVDYALGQKKIGQAAPAQPSQNATRYQNAKLPPNCSLLDVSSDKAGMTTIVYKEAIPPKTPGGDTIIVNNTMVFNGSGGTMHTVQTNFKDPKAKFEITGHFDKDGKVDPKTVQAAGVASGDTERQARAAGVLGERVALGMRFAQSVGAEAAKVPNGAGRGRTPGGAAPGAVPDNMKRNDLFGGGTVQFRPGP